MNFKSRFLWPIIAALTLCAGFAAGVAWKKSRSLAAQPLVSGSRIVPSRAVPDFQLNGSDRNPFTRASLLGHWSILYFGYSHCPDMCPTTLSSLAALMKSLRAAHFSPLPQVVFISVDGHRDTPETLAQYAPFFDASFKAAVAGEESRLTELTRSLGVAVIIGVEKQGEYTVDHTNALFVISPQAKLAAVLTSPLSADVLAADWRRLIGGAT